MAQKQKAIPKSTKYTIVHRRAKDKKYYWTLEAANGHVLATSQMYARRPHAVVDNLNKAINQGGTCCVCTEKADG